MPASSNWPKCQEDVKPKSAKATSTKSSDAVYTVPKDCYAARPAEAPSDTKRSASQAEYNQCLHENGL